MQHRSVYLMVFFLGMGLLMTACAPIPTSAAIPPTPTPISGSIDVGGYQLRIRCAGQGTPTVIVDSGLNEAAAQSAPWRLVSLKIAETTQICVYDRAGIGMSTRAPGQSELSRTSQDMVNDLHTLLVNANVPGPYILVGHSIGGYNVRLYAGQYPKEVAGVVLVDSSHPDQLIEMLAALPPEESNESDSLKNLRSSMKPLSNVEKMDVIESADQVRSIRSLGDLPLVVLSRAPGATIPDVPADLSAKLDQIWQDLQLDLVGLSTNSTHLIATHAGHNIQADEPQLVIEAILKVLSQAKK